MTSTYYYPGTYFGRARAQFHYGNGYQTFTAYRIENIHVALNDSPVRINQAGGSYGSVPYYPEGLDLISAVGELGCVGYVRDSDLNSNKADSPGDAAALGERGFEERSVPV